MAATPKQTEIIFFEQCPIDDVDTLYLGPGAANAAYFAYLMNNYENHPTESTLSYQREAWYVRVRVDVDGDDLTSEALTKCNYLSFMNPGNENRHYFGRITWHEYVNEGNWRVHFIIDHWLTWADTIKNVQGRLERVHYTNETNPMSNTAQRIETVDCGEYVTAFHKDVIFDEVHYVAHTWAWPDGQMRDEIYTRARDPANLATTMLYIDTTDIGGFNNWLYAYKDFPEGISNVYTYAIPSITDVTLPGIPDLGEDLSIGAWTKCYKFPMMYVRVINGLGDEKVYYMEHFFRPDDSGSKERSNPKFKFVSLSWGGVACVVLVPLGYKGKEENWEEAFYYDKYPSLQWAKDSFGQWWSINSNREIIRAGISAVGIIAGAGMMATGAGGALGVGMVAGGVSSLATQAGGLDAQSKQPDQLMGTPNYNGQLQLALGRAGFHFDIMRPISGLINANNNYYNAYGYKSGHVGPVNMFNHPYWNYCKGQFTFSCGGNKDAHEKIKSMFANGVRLWHIAAPFIGDFSQDNRA